MGVNVVKDYNARMQIKNTIKYTLAPNTLPFTRDRNGTGNEFNAKISNHVTCMKLYLVPFEALVKEGKVKK